MDLSLILKATILIVLLIASLVHFFPKWLTRLVEKRLFRILGVEVTIQRALGFIGSVATAISLYQLF